MIHNTQYAAGGGGASSEWTLLPAAAQTRAPVYGYYNFVITFEGAVPKAVLFKNVSSSYDSCGCAYIFGLDIPEVGSAYSLIVTQAELNGNVFSGQLQYTDSSSGDFYYLPAY